MIRTTLLTLAVSALALGAAAAPARSAASQHADRVHAANLSKEDRDFLNDAAQGGLLEVKLGEVAVKQAGSDDVKKFGQRMIDDHTKVNSRLADIARDAGVILPTELTKKQQDDVTKLSQLAGAKFDKEYMSRMVDDHEHDVKAFEKASKDSKDPALKQFAASTLPTLHEHLTMAKQIDDRIKK
jgi:putative membrane protein